MAYQTGTATGPEDLIDKLFSFASSNGWTINEATTGTRAHFKKNNIYVGFYYTSSLIKIYPARGYTSSTEPNAQPGVAYDQTLTTDGGVNALTGPYDGYWFFEDDNYLHVVVTTNNNIYRHFGFGESIQAGSIIGGEYFYQHYHSQNLSQIKVLELGYHAYPFCAAATNSKYFSSMFFYGRKNTSPETALSGATTADTKWYNSNASAAFFLDGDGDAAGLLQLSGTLSGRGSSIMSVGSSNLNGFVPLYPISLYIRDNTTAPDSLYPVGSPPDVRTTSIKAVTDAQEITVGSDTWVIFPVSRRGITTDVESTGNMGLAYKKVTT